MEALVQAQRDYFFTGATLPLSFRRQALERLRRAILQREEEIYAALAADLNKSPAESYMCEVGLTLSELGYVSKNLPRWMRDSRRPASLAQFPAKSFVRALRGGPHPVPLELPLPAGHGASDWSHRRGQLLYCQALRLLPPHLRGPPKNFVGLLFPTLRVRGGGGPGGKPGPAGPEI